MKIAVISFSGNVGKTTIARHLLAPRIPGARLVSIESINAGAAANDVIPGRQFAELQEYLQVADDVVVDIGASNAADTTDYKALIAASAEKAERLALARRLSAHRLAKGLVPSLDACFASLELVPRARQPAVEAALA